VVLVVIGLLRQEVRYRYLGSIEKYLMKMEAVVYEGCDDDHPEGWERYYRRSGSPWNRHLRRAVWIVLLVGSSVIAWTGGLLPEAETSRNGGSVISAERTLPQQDDVRR
jgi:hypothetical protein